MPVYRLDQESIQGVYRQLQDVANVCRDDEIQANGPTPFADSYLSACDLAGAAKEGRERIAIRLNGEGGQSILARSDALLRELYAALRTADAADGVLDGAIAASAPLTVHIPSAADSRAIWAANQAAVIKIRRTVVTGASGIGSGFIVGREELPVARGGTTYRYTVYTAGHMVDNMYEEEKKVEAIIPAAEGDGSPIPTTTLGVDHKADFAVLTFVSPILLPTVRLGDSSGVRPTDQTVTLGNRRGEGIVPITGDVVNVGVSAASANFYAFDTMTVSDAGAPGDSGGPVFNAAGDVIGIAIQVERAEDSGGRLSYLLPINRASQSAALIRKNGVAEYGDVGCTFDLLPDEAKKQIGAGSGIVLSFLDPTGPAARAGLQNGDVVIAIDGDASLTRIGDFAQMPRVKTYFLERPGKDTRLTVWRAGRQLTVSLTVGKSALSSPRVWHTPYQFTAVELDRRIRWLALTAARFDGGGVFVQTDGDKPTEYGLPSDVVVTQVGETPVASLKEFRDAVERQQGRETLLLRYVVTDWTKGYSTGSSHYVSVPVPK